MHTFIEFCMKIFKKQTQESSKIHHRQSVNIQNIHRARQHSPPLWQIIQHFLSSICSMFFQFKFYADTT
jgi:hypothetical protein